MKIAAYLWLRVKCWWRGVCYEHGEATVSYHHEQKPYCASCATRAREKKTNIHAEREKQFIQEIESFKRRQS